MPTAIVLLTLLWWVVSGGAASSWLIGLPAIGVAAWLLRGPLRGRSWRLGLGGSLRLAGYFLYGSLRGGLDVAGRVLARRPRVAPGLVHHRWNLPDDGLSRPLFVLSMSLLPGTLVARFDDEGLLIHTLDTRLPIDAEVDTLERLIRAAVRDARPAAQGTGA